VLSGEATNTNFIVFGLTRPGLESTIYHTRSEYANHYTTDAVSFIGRINSTNIFEQMRFESIDNDLKKFLCEILMKESLNSDSQQFHQHQQNKQLPQLIGSCLSDYNNMCPCLSDYNNMCPCLSDYNNMCNAINVLFTCLSDYNNMCPCLSDYNNMCPCLSDYNNMWSCLSDYNNMCSCLSDYNNMCSCLSDYNNMCNAINVLFTCLSDYNNMCNAINVLFTCFNMCL
jgi:hypothetical protein